MQKSINIFSTVKDCITQGSFEAQNTGPVSKCEMRKCGNQVMEMTRAAVGGAQCKSSSHEFEMSGRKINGTLIV